MLKTIDNEIKNNPKIKTKNEVEGKKLQITIDQLRKNERGLAHNQGHYRVKAKIEDFTFQTTFNSNNMNEEVLNEASKQNFKLLEKYFHEALVKSWAENGEDFLKRVSDVVKK